MLRLYRGVDASSEALAELITEGLFALHGSIAFGPDPASATRSFAATSQGEPVQDLAA
jgi:hypothetical protein